MIRFGVPESLVFDNGLQFDSFANSAATSALRTGIQPQRIRKAMGKLRPLTKQL